MPNIEYIVKAGDRWDSISHKCYGVSTEVETIIRANKHIKVGVLPEVGAVLTIPVIEAYQIKTKSELLPPWKR